jgi:prepilin-type N-terminal cleavage/methylation domain-containing protein
MSQKFPPPNYGAAKPRDCNPWAWGGARKRFAGFTLVELLVVIAIIGVLVALLLPAVQAAREAARRMQCGTNLKQLGLAMHNYHDAHRSLPSGVIWEPSWPLGPMGSTWITLILPYIEQGTLADGVVKNQGFGGATGGNVPIVREKLPFMLCSTDVESKNVNPMPAYPDGVYAKGNYGANNGVGPMQPGGDPLCRACPIPRLPGLFMNNSKTRLAKIPDGTSHTVAVAELLKGPDTGGSVGGGWQGVMHYWEGPLYQHDRTPNTSVADELRTGWCGTDRPFAPCIETYNPYDEKLILSSRSAHAGGVHVGFADGSVHWIADEIPLTVWQNLGRPDDGNVIAASDFSP